MLALHSNFGTARHRDQQVRPCAGSYPVRVSEPTFWRTIRVLFIEPSYSDRVVIATTQRGQGIRMRPSYNTEVTEITRSIA